MAKTTFSGPVVSKNGFLGNVKGSITPTAPTIVFAGDIANHLAADNEGAFIRDTADSDTLKYSNGTAWKAVELAT